MLRYSAGTAGIRAAIGAVCFLWIGPSACVPGGGGQALFSGSSVSYQPGVVATLERARRVLWVGAHPDDEVSSSGLLARAKHQGASLYLVSLTRGENSYDLWGGLRRGSEIGRSRAALFAQAASVLHADGFELGPFTNGPWIHGELDLLPADAPHRDWAAGTAADDVIRKWRKEGDPVAYLVDLLRRVRPDVVVALDHHCGVTGHKEHMALARLLVEAIKSVSDSDTGLKVGSVIYSARVTPDLVACGFCTCEGEAPLQPAEEVGTAGLMPEYGLTEAGVACLVARTYEQTMLGRRWSEEQLREPCSEEAAHSAGLGRSGPFPPEVYRLYGLP